MKKKKYFFNLKISKFNNYKRYCLNNNDFQITLQINLIDNKDNKKILSCN